MATLWEKARATRNLDLRRQLMWLLTSAQWLVSVMYATGQVAAEASKENSQLQRWKLHLETTAAT